MQFTFYDDIDELLKDLRHRMQQILDEKLLGLYLYGSLVSGDFVMEISDIDLLAVTSSVIDNSEFEKLQRMHSEFTTDNPNWSNRIEIQYVSINALETFKTQTSKIANISPGEPFHFIEAGKDWLMNWYFVQEYGVTLFGPAPTTFIEPIAKEEYLEAVREQGQSYGEWIKHKQKRNDQSYVILTLCRALYTLENGEQVSKKQAALWAQKHLPQWASLIQNALAWRAASFSKEEVNHEATMPETTRFIRFAIRQITSS